MQLTADRGHPFVDISFTVSSSELSHQYRSFFITYHYSSAGLSEDSDYTSDVSYPAQQNPYAQSHHHANSSSSQFESTRKLKPCMSNSSEQHSQQSATNNANYQTEQINECVNRPKRELPFGGSTDPRNIKAALMSSNCSENASKDAAEGTTTDPLYYNSRPRRALPQINFNNNKEKYELGFCYQVTEIRVTFFLSF